DVPPEPAQGLADVEEGRTEIAPVLRVGGVGVDDPLRPSRVAAPRTRRRRSVHHDPPAATPSGSRPTFASPPARRTPAAGRSPPRRPFGHFFLGPSCLPLAGALAQ